MGLKLGNILPRRDVSFLELKRKTLAVDTYVHLYEFLTTLPKLTDKHGRVTSHLNGLFFRTTRLIAEGVNLCFVFDGFFPSVGMHYKRFYRSAKPRITKTVTKYVVDSSKRLLRLLGLPVIQAPSEAEAQAAFMCSKGDVWAVASKDLDAIMFCARRLVQNLTFSKKRKLPKGGFVWYGPYLYEWEEIRRSLGLDKKKFIAVCILSGTDFNPGGVPGIGPKKALKLVKRYGLMVFSHVKWPFAFHWKDLFYLIENIPVTMNYRLKWGKIKRNAIMRFLCDEHNFDVERVESTLNKLENVCV